MVTGDSLNPRSDLMTGQRNPMTREHERMTSTAHHDNRRRRPLNLQHVEDEPVQITSSPMYHVVTVISNLSHILQSDATDTQIPNTQWFQRQIPSVRTSPTQSLATIPEPKLKSSTSTNFSASCAKKQWNYGKRCASLQKQPRKVYWKSTE